MANQKNSAAENLLLALELWETGLEIQRMNLKRENPTLNEEAIAQLLTEWLETRPCSPHGDAPGPPGSLDRFNRAEP
jgi:hypothetical protein